MFMSIWNIEYAIIPLIGWVSWLYGWVIVRQWLGQAKSKLKKAENYIRKGGFVYLSIEGKRSRDGSLNPFNKGPVVLAIQSQAKIFPVFTHIAGMEPAVNVNAFSCGGLIFKIPFEDMGTADKYFAVSGNRNFRARKR